MSIWKIVFEHRFIDENLHNLRASPGLLTVSDPSPRITKNDGEKIYSLNHANLGQDSWFGYQFAEPITDIIGFQFETYLQITPPPGVDLPVYDRFAMMNLNGGEIVVETVTGGAGFRAIFGSNVISPPRDPDLLYRLRLGYWVKLRWDWLSTGQSRISINNKLVALNSDIQFGRIITLQRLQVGGSAIYPHSIYLKFFKLKVLRRFDAAAELESYLQIDENDRKQLEQCGEYYKEKHEWIRKAYEQFMHDFLVRETKVPRGKRGALAPLKKRASKAHKVSTELAGLIYSYFRGDLYGRENEILQRLKEFLTLLAESDKTAFVKLWHDLNKGQGESKKKDPCEQIAMAMAEKYKSKLSDLTQFLEEALKIIEQIAREAKI